jgi:hypothetical protein
MGTTVISPGNPNSGMLESAPPAPPGAAAKPPVGNAGAVASEPQSNSAQVEVAQRAMAAEKLLLSIGQILPNVAPQIDQIIETIRSLIGGAITGGGQPPPQGPMGAMGAMMGAPQQ